jgi:hypothetical protein
MKKFLSLATICVICTQLFSQEKLPADLSNEITIGELRDHLFYLASDELKGRYPGTSGFEKAAEYIITQLKQAGFTPVIKDSAGDLSFYQLFDIYRFEPDPNSRITVVHKTDSKEFALEKDFILDYGGPYNINELSGGLVFIGNGIKESEYGINDFKGLNLKGKWAIVQNLTGKLPSEIENKLPNEIRKRYGSGTEKRRIIEKNIKEEGGIGIITILPSYKASTWNRNLMKNHFQYSLIDPRSGLNPREYSMPRIFLDSAMVDYVFANERYNPYAVTKLYSTFELKNTQLTLYKNYQRSTINTENIVAIIEGTDAILKNEYISLGAHLDTYEMQKNQIMNGANDNASGCAGLLEIAEALNKTKTKRSIIVVFYSKEESGLSGSFYFTENPPIPLNNILVNINIDMVGRSVPDVKRLAPVAADRITPKFYEIISNVSKRDKYDLDWEFAKKSYSDFAGSDHFPFHLKSIPSVYMFSGDDPDYHKPTDDPDKINYELLRDNAEFIFNLTLELANCIVDFNL